MLRSEFSSETAGNGERAAARILTQFLIRHCVVIASMGEGDLVRGLILAAVLDANVRDLLNEPSKGMSMGGIEGVPPDAMRTPISVSALGRQLNIPYETTRRHVGRLIDEGACIRVDDRGVIVPAAFVASRKDVTQLLYDNLCGVLRVLSEAGFDLEAMARSAPAEN